MRSFTTGATRDDDTLKPDYEGFFNPMVLEAYANYMTVHRVQADGEIRDSDNWQNGMPAGVYIKSLFRHLVDLWKLHRGYVVTDRKDGHEIDREEACCAIMFNIMGYLFEILHSGRPPMLSATFNLVKRDDTLEAEYTS